MNRVRILVSSLSELDFPVNLSRPRIDLGADRVICGNVSTVDELLRGTPEDVYEACRRCHQVAGQYHIVGAGCEVSPLTPAENLRAMITYAAEHKP